MWFRNLFDSLKPGRSRTKIQQAWRRQPASCRPSVEALEDRSVPAAMLSVGDVAIREGNFGIQYAEVVVSLSEPHGSNVTVNYKTADGTATAGSDYDGVSGQLTFARGETSKTILVPVNGDRVAEPNEQFFVQLSNAKGAKIADGQGIVTTLDDEPHISINEVSAAEGNSGTTIFTFTVSLSAAYDDAVTVTFATQDGTAVAGEDYLANSGTLTFARGETTKTITVEVLGDATPEPEESFLVNLGGVSTNAVIEKASAYGTVLDDDGYVPPDDNSEPWGNDWYTYYVYGGGQYY